MAGRVRARRRHGSNNAASFASMSLLTPLPWVAAYWTQGPRMLARGYGNGASVTTWDDEIGSSNLSVLGTGPTAPTWTAAHTSFRNAPAVLFNGTTSRVKSGNPTSQAQPFSVVAVVKYETVDLSSRFIGTNNLSSVAGMGITAGSKWVLSSTSNLTSSGNADTNPHLFRDFFSGASSQIEVDGTTIVTGDASTSGFAAFSIGGDATTNGTNFANASVVFAGYLYSNALTASGWSLFRRIVQARYGIIVA